MSWKNVQVNCRDFACDNNNKGNCQLENIILSAIGNGIVGHLICNESAEKWPEKAKPEEQDVE